MLELKMKANLLGAATGGLAAFIHKGYVGGDLPDRLRERMWLGERYADFGVAAVEDLMGRLQCECEESGSLLDTVVSEADRACWSPAVELSQSGLQAGEMRKVGAWGFGHRSTRNRA